MKTLSIIIILFLLPSCRFSKSIWQFSYPQKIDGYNIQNETNKLILTEKGKGQYKLINLSDQEIKLLTQKQKLPNGINIAGRLESSAENDVVLNLYFIQQRRLSNEEQEILILEMKKINVSDNYTIYGKKINDINDSTISYISNSKPYEICIKYPKSFMGIVKRSLLTPFTAFVDIYANIGFFLDVNSWKQGYSDQKHGMFSVLLRPAKCGFDIMH